MAGVGGAVGGVVGSAVSGALNPTETEAPKPANDMATFKAKVEKLAMMKERKAF